MVKKDVVKHAYTAACNGVVRSKTECIANSREMVKGARFERDEEEGVRDFAPSSAKDVCA